LPLKRNEKGAAFQPLFIPHLYPFAATNSNSVPTFSMKALLTDPVGIVPSYLVFYIQIADKDKWYKLK
jgi:hypothetical protein